MALLAVVLCVNFTACSKDDGGGDGSVNNNGSVNNSGAVSLKGTTWKVINGDEDFEDGTLLYFKADGTIVTSPYEDIEGLFYSQNGNTLKIIIYGEAYIQGEFTIKDKTATYYYKWYELDGTYIGDNYGNSIMTLQKQ